MIDVGDIVTYVDQYDGSWNLAIVVDVDGNLCEIKYLDGCRPNEWVNANELQSKRRRIDEAYPCPAKRFRSGPNELILRPSQPITTTPCRPTLMSGRRIFDDNDGCRRPGKIYFLSRRGFDPSNCAQSTPGADRCYCD